MVTWGVTIGEEFEPEFDVLHEDVQTEILALSRLLQRFGPGLGRPRVDTLNGSRHPNMKELRFGAADGNGESSLRSIHGAGRSSSPRETSRASVTSGSTAR
jgi:hypothetical protein